MTTRDAARAELSAQPYLGASRSAISVHYDLSNEFFAQWLDPRMVYSCALWNDPNDPHDLEQAQLAKIDFHIRAARAGGRTHVLDIGCGWGATLKRLVTDHGVERALGLTLSSAQVEHIGANPEPGVEVRLENWADHQPDQAYGAIISVGAFEHFARRGLSEPQKHQTYRSFFEKCHGWLTPGGYMALQTISYENPSSGELNAFIAKEIFPESELPFLAEIARACERLFVVERLRNDGHDYIRTLRAWRRRLRDNRARAIDVAGTEVVTRHERYLDYCILSFHDRATGLLRLALRRLDRPAGRSFG